MENEDSQSILADDAAVVLAARFGSLIAHWNGEVDEPFEARARVLNGLCRSVVQLQRGMHRSIRENFDLENLMEAKEKAEEEELKRKMIQPCRDMLKLPVMAKIFGGGEAGRKIAQYVLAVQRGNLDADLDILPTDQFEIQEAAGKKEKPVKPPRKRRTAQQAGKTRAQKASNPLEEKEMEGEKTEESSQDQSKSIKVNQSDLAQPTVEAKTTSQENSVPPNPISPLSPISHIAPPENSDAQELQRMTPPAQNGLE
jgi:hypothetical protein